MKKVNLYPSIICMDIYNLNDEINAIINLGIETVHVDIIDGHFSPSNPIGIDVISNLKSFKDIKLDVHIMSINNEYFIDKCIDYKVDRISFHCETTLHIDRMVRKIKKLGIQVGLALNPATSLSVLDYIIDELDFVLLMLVNPGFAGDKNEGQVPYAGRKIQELRSIIDKNSPSTKIQVDGRISFDNIPIVLKNGADDLVLGSTSLFDSRNTIEKNKQRIDSMIADFNGSI